MDRVKIGIYYIDADWALDKFSEIISYIPYEKIQMIERRANGECQCVTYDGNMLQTVKLADSARGKRFDRVFIQKDIIDMLLPDQTYWLKYAMSVPNSHVDLCE